MPHGGSFVSQEVETKTEMMGQQICLLKIRFEERDEFLQVNRSHPPIN